VGGGEDDTDPKKVIICRCENVTLADLDEAIEKGYTDLESLKRYLRIGMGPCQGVYCLPFVARYLARKTGRKIEELYMPRNRPPLSPVRGKYFTERRDDED
jgi:NAD(P)H-nitrite reductase large subunit